jgi:hypothetical protein
LDENLLMQWLQCHPRNGTEVLSIVLMTQECLLCKLSHQCLLKLCLQNDWSFQRWIIGFFF